MASGVHGHVLPSNVGEHVQIHQMEVPTVQDLDQLKRREHATQIRVQVGIVIGAHGHHAP